ncbi:MAG: ATP-binding protein [Nibricoccus sp.]
MLTRDVQLSRAIIDLVDNSVDGAQRLRGNGRYDGLWIRIELSRDSFKVSDNCGGISVDIARNYAFRFGRSKNEEGAPGSVGLFGVGMKRTFFKLGRQFTVRSKCRTEHFSLAVNVDQWIAEEGENGPDDWHFEFGSVEEHTAEVPLEETGTQIEVTRLLQSVAENFSLEQFHAQLLNELGAAHAVSVDKGLAITVNMIPLQHLPQKLFVSGELKPAFVQKSYPRTQIDGIDGEPVTVKLYAGVAERSLHDGGWYVFCNGRLVLRADQTALTVWGERNEMRQYHPDFAFFRGYAYIDSLHSTLLPWTTTKTGVDVDAPIYKIIQREMIEITKPVIAFLSELARQRDADREGEWSDGRLNSAITTASATRTEEIAEGAFVAPRANAAPPGPRMQKIQYTKLFDEVERAKVLLKARSYKEVGEKTFEYYLEYEGK